MGRSNVFKYLKEYKFYIVLFLFILIPIIAIDTSTRSPRNYRFYDRVIVAITSPIQASISWSLDFTVSTVQNYIYLWNTKKNNETLLTENRRLLNTIVNLREAQEENIRLRN